MQDRLFRKSSLDRLASPEQLDQLMQVTTPRGWLAVLGLAALMLVVGVWGIFGSIPTTIPSQGILIRGSGIQTAQAAATGQIASITVQPGDNVTPGQVIATIQTPDQAAPVEVKSTVMGRVLELRVNVGSFIQMGTPLLSMELSAEPLLAIVYVSPVAGKKLHAGMTVQISPSTVRKEEYGMMLGKVISVGEFPVTYQGMLRVLGSDELIRALPVGGASIEVVVEPLKADTESGYAWTSPKGPPTTLQSGTFVAASIITEERHPVELIFAN